MIEDKKLQSGDRNCDDDGIWCFAFARIYIFWYNHKLKNKEITT